MLVTVGILLEFQLVQRRDILFRILVVKGHQIGNRVISVLEPGEEQPVHDIRIPAAFRYGRIPKENHIWKGFRR